MKTDSNRNLWIDYLRSSITVLVIAHHSALAYTTFSTFNKDAYILSTHPVVDANRWGGLDILVSFNDVFFMSLMFMIGGLFLSKSIGKKGAASFIKDRVYRLLLPFLIGGTLLMLIAYFPAFYLAHKSTNIANYIIDFFTVEQYPVGPPWFIWVLFAFNFLFALSYPILNKIYEKVGRYISALQNKPVLAVAGLFILTWLLYVPVAYNIGAGTWTGYGPFDFQVSRVLLYFGYFMLGVLIGYEDFNNNLLSEGSAIVKKWWLWSLLAAFVFIILTIVPPMLTQAVISGELKEFNSWMIYYAVFVASCTLSSIAFVTAFRKFIRLPKRWWNSLSENAYLIYLVHYVFVTWIQFALLKYEIPAALKFLITFSFALALSWATSILLRKFSIIKKYL